ncbi:hypothetical protein Acsp06_07890 [Actinomycetospora sp. NBRC 106375]|uniref:WXG100 family type VII secretion target n=1 Tax=Actinomycetospora sp. NBRC 106375 TaxID=3032207 RepID=UPI0024A121CE|nr:WXG100 family type VII secretion target [Actinomycetospora sp. NBRC 106375]GLZ44604.1 hypothetical protein Acsp06_07890 [Actinomycetospora sp. NBRC 106375]
MSEIRVSFGEIEGAQANIARGASAIEQELADLDGAIAQLSVWDGAASDFYRQRQQQIRTSWEDMKALLAQIGTRTGAVNANYQNTENQVRNMFA